MAFPPLVPGAVPNLDVGDDQEDIMNGLGAFDDEGAFSFRACLSRRSSRMRAIARASEEW